MPVDARVRDAAVAAYLAGESAARVARRHRVSQVTVLTWVRRAGHQTRPRRVLLSGDQREEVARRYAEGDSPHDLAREFGISPGYASALASARRLPQRPRGRTRGMWVTPAHVVDEAIAQVRAGRAVATAAEGAGVTPATVMRWLRAAEATG